MTNREYLAVWCEDKAHSPVRYDYRPDCPDPETIGAALRFVRRSYFEALLQIAGLLREGWNPGDPVDLL